VTGIAALPAVGGSRGVAGRAAADPAAVSASPLPDGFDGDRTEGGGDGFDWVHTSAVDAAVARSR